MPEGMVCLPTADPLLCPPEEKAEREARNALRQILYIEEMVSMGVRSLRESHVREFQRLAIDGIFPCGGAYRTPTRTAALDGGGVLHVPPEPALVPSLVVDAIDEVNRRLERRRDADDDAIIDAAAYALWRFNWIHPFAGGNGRTSRAIAYLLLSFDYGRAIPGTPSVPTAAAMARAPVPVTRRSHASRGSRRDAWDPTGASRIRSAT